MLGIALTAGGPCARAQEKEDNPVELGASYTGDVVNNLSGGIKTGSAYLGMATMTLGFDTEKARLWRGGRFYVMGANTHGDTPSATLIGDLQTASNLEAGNHTYLQELWYRQRLGRVELTAGLQDMAVEFGSVEYGGLYLNSSFGVKSSISHNIPAPIFPLTNLGFTVKWEISDRFTWLAAAYDGNPEPFEANPYNIKWEFQGGDGYLVVTELQYHTAIRGLGGTCKIGALYHEQKPGGESRQEIVSIYGNANQQLWASGGRNLGAFVQFGYSPSDASTCKHYIGAGVNFTGLASRRGRDELGLAFAYENFKHDIASETAIELTWKYTLSDNFFIQPDLQYIVNPAGTGEKLKNSFCANIRLGISL